MGGEHSAGAGSGSRLLFQQGPIEGVIILVIQGAKQDTEQLP